jgi:DNA-binding NarL/FixJ family response regulator
MVVLDYSLPDGDGLEALDYLKSHPVNRAATRVMVAGEENLDIAIAAVKNGCHGYIPKARLTADALREAVAEAVLGIISEESSHYNERIRNATVEVLNGISNACFDQIKPNLAHMLSELRGLRQGEHLFDERGLQQRVVTLEKSCAEIWHFIHEFETYREDWCRPTN